MSEEKLSKATKELFNAIDIENLNGITRAIKDGADLTASQNGYTPLTKATYNERIEPVRLLIENGADVNLKDEKGSPAIIYAARYGKANIVELLIKNNADIRLRNNNGYTALMTAKENDKLGVVSIIEEYLKTKELPLETTEKWVRNNNSGISFIGIYPEQEQKITQIFNFVTRQQIITVKDIDTNITATPLIVSFNALDKKILVNVLNEFKDQGGDTDENFVLSGDNYISKIQKSNSIKPLS